MERKTGTLSSRLHHCKVYSHGENSHSPAGEGSTLALGPLDGTPGKAGSGHGVALAIPGLASLEANGDDPSRAFPDPAAVFVRSPSLAEEATL
jgi:hypothetical protein